MQGFANYTYNLMIALNRTQADVRVNGTLIIQQVRYCENGFPPSDMESWGISLVVPGKFYMSSVSFSSCVMIVTFFDRSSIVSCLGPKSTLLLYVKYDAE